MRISERLILETAIQSAVDKIADKGENIHLIYDDQVEDMTKAAELVYDASRKGQEYAEN